MKKIVYKVWEKELEGYPDNAVVLDAVLYSPNEESYFLVLFTEDEIEREKIKEEAKRIVEKQAEDLANLFIAECIDTIGFNYPMDLKDYEEFLKKF